MITVHLVQFVLEAIIVAHLLQVAPTVISVQDIVLVVLVVTPVMAALEVVWVVFINAIFVMINVFFLIINPNLYIVLHYQLGSFRDQ